MKNQANNKDGDVFEDDDFIERFENGAFPPERFHHREHIRLTWLYLKRFTVPEALDRVSKGIRRFAAALGKADRYHETITWAYVFLVHERMARDPQRHCWGDFIEANQDLLGWNPGILSLYYRKGTLASDLAKQVFLLPDKIA